MVEDDDAPVEPRPDRPGRMRPGRERPERPGVFDPTMPAQGAATVPGPAGHDARVPGLALRAGTGGADDAPAGPARRRRSSPQPETDPDS